MVAFYLGNLLAFVCCYSGKLVDLLPILPKFLEFFMYVILGIAWVFPLKFVFQGIGQSNPDNDQDKK